MDMVDMEVIVVLFLVDFCLLVLLMVLDKETVTYMVERPYGWLWDVDNSL